MKWIIYIALFGLSINCMIYRLCNPELTETQLFLHLISGKMWGL